MAKAEHSYTNSAGAEMNIEEELATILAFKSDNLLENLIKIVDFFRHRSLFEVTHYDIGVKVTSSNTCFVIKQGESNEEAEKGWEYDSVSYNNNAAFNSGHEQPAGFIDTVKTGANSEKMGKQFNSDERKVRSSSNTLANDSDSQHEHFDDLNKDSKPGQDIVKSQDETMQDLKDSITHLPEDMKNTEALMETGESKSHACNVKEELGSSLANSSVDHDVNSDVGISVSASSIVSENNVSGVKTDTNTFKCCQCSHSFSKRLSLQVHELSHYKPSPEEEAMKRKKFLSKNRKFSCPQCTFKSGAKSTVTLHMWQKHKIYFFFTCDKCKQLFLSPEEHSKHMSSTGHAATVKLLSSGLNEPGRHSCSVCGHSAKSPFALKVHMLIHSNKRDFLCSKCSFRGRTVHELEKHEKRHNPQKNLQCTFCSFVTHDRRSLVQHTHTHLKTNHKYRCRDCDAKFADMPQLRKHALFEHSSGDVFFCPDCKFSCNTRKVYKEHRQIHVGIDQFTCSLCNYSTNDKYNLKVHEKSHHDLTLYQCTTCNKRYKTKRSLKDHMICHQEERPFACDKCDFKTKTERLLTNHMKKHINMKGYSCTICDYTTKYLSNLTKHELTHSSVRPHQCSLCNYSSKAPETLKKHFKIVHCKETKLT